MTDDDLPTPRSVPQGYDVSAWCRACRHTRRLNLRALIVGGRGDVPLIHLPLRCDVAPANLESSSAQSAAGGGRLDAMRGHEQPADVADCAVGGAGRVGGIAQQNVASRIAWLGNGPANARREGKAHYAEDRDEI